MIRQEGAAKQELVPAKDTACLVVQLIIECLSGVLGHFCSSVLTGSLA